VRALNLDNRFVETDLLNAIDSWCAANGYLNFLDEIVDRTFVSSKSVPVAGRVDESFEFKSQLLSMSGKRAAMHDGLSDSIRQRIIESRDNITKCLELELGQPIDEWVHGTFQLHMSEYPTIFEPFQTTFERDLDVVVTAAVTPQAQKRILKIEAAVRTIVAQLRGISTTILTDETDIEILFSEAKQSNELESAIEGIKLAGFRVRIVQYQVGAKIFPRPQVNEKYMADHSDFQMYWEGSPYYNWPAIALIISNADEPVIQWKAGLLYQKEITIKDINYTET